MNYPGAPLSGKISISKQAAAVEMQLFLVLQCRQNDRGHSNNTVGQMSLNAPTDGQTPTGVSISVPADEQLNHLVFSA